MSKEEQIRAALQLIGDHGGYERVKRILEQRVRNMEYRKKRQRDIYRDAMKYRAQK